MTTHNNTIPNGTPLGSTRTAPSAVHQDGGVKHVTGASSKICKRDNITIGTWNTRTLRVAGKLQELTGCEVEDCTLPVTHHAMTTYNHTIPDQSLPVSPRTTPSAIHQDRGVKYATSASSKIRGRDNITISTWNTRTLRAAGKLQKLTHEMDRYRWDILGLCEMR